MTSALQLSTRSEIGKDGTAEKGSSLWRPATMGERSIGAAVQRDIVRGVVTLPKSHQRRRWT